MQVQYTDFNSGVAKFDSRWSGAWRDCEEALSEMPLHLKESDQAGKLGSAIFDPVGTNEYIKKRLAEIGWATNVPIPAEYTFLGTDVDFIKDGLIGEVQFSNYPFLLNNVLRSELLVKSNSLLAGNTASGVIIITKAHMFPASNSTLYYEQAVNQLTALEKNKVFDVPIRLVGLFETSDAIVHSTWTKYDSRRYSRTVFERASIECQILAPRSPGGRCKIRRA